MMRICLSAAGFVGILAGVVLADAPLPENAKRLSAILEQLESNGLSRIKDVTFDDGVWEIEGVRGQKGVELHVDPVSGNIISELADAHSSLPATTSQTAAAIAKSLEDAGYAPVYELEWEKTYWEAEALHQNVRKKLKISPATGKILSEQVDD